MSASTNTDISSSRSQKRKPKTCRSSKYERKKFYFTTGNPPSERSLANMENDILRPYEIPLEFESIEEVKRFWADERNRKLKEKESNYTKHHTYRSRVNLLWKRERLFVPDETELPGKSITEDIDPDFFKIVSGRPIKDKTNIRQYLKDIRECFLTRLKIGYHEDEILLMDERHFNEKRKKAEATDNFLRCVKAFETFLKEDHSSSSILLQKAKEEAQKSEDKLRIIDGLRDELKKLQASILALEEKWRSCKMFQKFLYITAPSEWRKVYDPYFGKEDVGFVASDPCLFDSFREFPGDTVVDLESKISKFKDDIKQGQPPVLYFTHPGQLRDILEDLEKSNLIALAHCKELDFPAEKTVADLQKAKEFFEREQKNLEEEVKYLTRLVETEEENFKANKSKLTEIAFGLFRDLITNEEYLSIAAFVEDAFEDAVDTPNDNNLDMVTMIKEIELKYESLLLALDLLPNNVMVRTTKHFFREQKRELKEAKQAEKKVHQMEILLKRLSKSLASPKKGVKERRIVRRSTPPEEVMFKFELPKTLTKEEREFLFFFGKMADNVKQYKPLYA